ncbi:hypothetical protein O3P69_008651 [Scylla paramamosain]|uniref:Uncharacterized protein n=1 Tax=Scylla paramamosain TaxID=85552 RepID=A0AAW0SKY5_SCYPA
MQSPLVLWVVDYTVLVFFRFLSSKLKDKGEKLKEHREIVVEALKKAREQSKSEFRKDIPADINALEWKSRRKNENNQEELDSDDDEDEREDKLDPLKLMAYHSSCVKKPAHTQNGTVEENEDPTNAIAQELRRLELQDAEQESQSYDFGDKRNQILEEMRKRNGPLKDSFKPFRPISNPQPIPGLVHHTARPSSGTTKSIPQHEALKLEREFLVKEKERALSNAREQLGKIKTEKIGLPPPSSSLKYRDTNVNKHLLDSDDESDNSDDFYASEL